MQASIFDFIQDVPDVNSSHQVAFENPYGYKMGSCTVYQVDEDRSKIYAEIYSVGTLYCRIISFDEWNKITNDFNNIIDRHNRR